MKKHSVSVLVVLNIISFLSASSAKAESSIGDSAITVALCTVGGAVLGASTLPFYEESGDHTKNIFYGAALGAVAGVLISAYSGVKEGPDYDEEGKIAPKPASQLSLNETRQFRLAYEHTTALKGPASLASPIWSPIAHFQF